MKYAIILEGSDCTGKSSLADFLSRYYSEKGFTVSIVHNGPFDTPTDAFIAYATQMVEHQKMDDNHVTIWDRMLDSHIIYGMIYHHEVMTPGQVADLSKMKFDTGVIEILCDPGWDFSRQVWASRVEEEMIKDEKLMKCVHDSFALLGLATDFVYKHNDLLANEQALIAYLENYHNA